MNHRLAVEEKKPSIRITWETDIEKLMSSQCIEDVMISMLRPMPCNTVTGISMHVFSQPFLYHMHYNIKKKLSDGSRMTCSIHTPTGHCRWCEYNRPCSRYVILCYVINWAQYTLLTLSPTALMSLKSVVQQIQKAKSKESNKLFNYLITGYKTMQGQDFYSTRYTFTLGQHVPVDIVWQRHAQQLWQSLNLKDNIFLLDSTVKEYEDAIASLAW